MFSKFAVPLIYIYLAWCLMQYDWLVPSMRLRVTRRTLSFPAGLSLFPPGFRPIFRAGQAGVPEQD